jgi:hypothetical protein
MKIPVAQVNPNWLIVFAALYPFILIPGALFFTPAIIDDSTYQAVYENFFILPKVLFMGVFATLGLVITRKIWTRDVFVWLAIGHLMFVTLSSFNANDDWTFIFLGPQWRLDGLLYHIFLTFLMIAAYFTLKSQPKAWNTIILVLVIGGCVETVIFMFQRLNLDPINPLLFSYGRVSTNITGTMSNRGYLAAWLLPIAILGLPKLFQKKYHDYTLFFWIIALFLIIIGLSLTDNRTAIYSFYFTLFIWNIFYKSIKNMLISILIAFIATIAPFLAPNVSSKEIRTFGDTTSLSTRTQIWQLTVNATHDVPLFPLLGGGADALRLSMLRNLPIQPYVKLIGLELGWKNYEVDSAAVVVPDNQLRLSEISVKFKRFGTEKNVTKNYLIELDRAHNYFLDRLIAFGIFSVFIWAILFFYPVWLGIWNRTSVTIFSISLALIAVILYYILWFPDNQAEPLHIIIISSAWAFLISKKRESVKL